MECIVLVGLPGSGKTTYVENINSDNKFHIASTDNLIDKYANENGLTYTEAWNLLSVSKTVNLKTIEEKMFSEFMEAVNAKKDIIVDRTNMSIKSRKKFLSKLSSDYVKKAVIFNIDDTELKNRLSKRYEETGKYIPIYVLNMMKDSYEEPTAKEFNEIILNN